jgi:hypothetical protein
MRGLGDPATGLDRLVSGLSATAAELAPVAGQQAELVRSLETTFAALARVGRPEIQATIAEAPRTERAATRELPQIRPLLSSTAGLLSDLEPTADELIGGAPDLAAALEAGVPAFDRLPRLTDELRPSADALAAFNDDPVARAGLRSLTSASAELARPLRFIAPAQTVCNYGAILARNLYRLASLGTEGGSWLRFIVFDVPKGPNSEGGPSSGVAAGGGDDPRNYLHSNPYPNTAAPGQPRECEAGNEPYEVGRTMVGNPPGEQSTVTSGQAAAGGRESGR